MTGWYDRHVVPRLIGCACSTRTIRGWRRRIVPLARGRVLELGIGGGLNLPFYDPARVEALHAVEPSAEQRARAGALNAPVPLEVRDGCAEDLPYPDASFDCVVSTFTLCSVDSLEQSAAEARRVLKPGGALLVCEHGLSPDRRVRRTQQRLEPVWSRLSGGCRLTRRPREALADAGFDVGGLQQRYMRNTPRFAGWLTAGEAVAV
jgi:SAM-dependent methyltransferase